MAQPDLSGVIVGENEHPPCEAGLSGARGALPGSHETPGGSSVPSNACDGSTRSQEAPVQPMPPPDDDSSESLRKRGEYGCCTSEPVQHATSTSPTNLQHVVLPGGILSPEILGSVDAVCQHADCLSAEPTPVGAAFAARLPHACPFASRVSRGRRLVQDPPGTVERCAPAEGVSAPLVFNLFTMLRAALPLQSRQRDGQADTADQRVVWFEQCLADLEQQLEDGASVAFPYRIGCGYGGGKWRRYLKLLCRFAVRRPDLRVLIVQSSQSFIQEQHPERRLCSASRRAYAILDKCKNAETKAVGRALLAGVEAHIRDSLCAAAPQGEDGEAAQEVPDFQERAHVFTAAVDTLSAEQQKMREAMRERLRVEREAEDKRYQEYLSAQLRSGLLSLEAMAAARNLTALVDNERPVDLPTRASRRRLMIPLLRC